ncbi:MAG TPA: hypothetical protein VIY97_00845 [Candidatus Methanoperedens sp.]
MDNELNPLPLPCNPTLSPGMISVTLHDPFIKNPNPDRGPRPGARRAYAYKPPGHLS